MTTDRIGLQIRTATGPGVLHQLTGVIAQQRGDISSVAIASQSAAEDRVYLEIDLPGRAEDLVAALEVLDVVRGVEVVDTLKHDLRQADHHHGRRRAGRPGRASARSPRPTATTSAASTSRWTPFRSSASSRWPTPCAPWRACRAPARSCWPGSLMGGDIEKAVREVRAQGLLVISLNMAGSVPEAADLVVTDPVQAGVMAVMAIAETAKFRWTG